LLVECAMERGCLSRGGNEKMWGVSDAFSSRSVFYI
jgi:hypothetical protein